MMNGHSSNVSASCAPAYSLIHDVNGGSKKPAAPPAGRFTLISNGSKQKDPMKTSMYHSMTNTNGLANNGNAGRRAHSQMDIDQPNRRNYVQHHYQSSQAAAQKSYCNGNSYDSLNTSDSVSSYNSRHANGNHNGSSAEVNNRPNHFALSTLQLREKDRDYHRENRSFGGSYSCGQPSPSSTTEVGGGARAGGPGSSLTLSPNSSRTLGPEADQSHWLHRSEINLQTDNAYSTLNINGSGIGHGRSNYDHQHYSSESCLESCSGKYPENAGPYRDTTFGNNSTTQYFSKPSAMYSGQGRQNGGDSNYSTGPSFRKIQNIHGGGSAQKRFPSDTNLSYNSRDGSQIYTSGSRPGPVTIPARSRSAQPSANTSPIGSPKSFHRSTESNIAPDYSQDNRSRVASKTQHQYEYSYSNTPTGPTSPISNSQATKFNSVPTDEPDEDAPILPSVREIIRQVEAMTQSNAATSTSDISSANGTSLNRPNQRQEQGSGTQRRPFQGGGILRQPGSSQRTPSAPQLRTTSQYTPIQTRFNSAVNSSPAKTVCPPVPPHGNVRSKAIIGSFTRRVEPAQPEINAQLSRNDFNSLREAFIEQRREIQRLRKQLSEKELMVNQLERDIRLYEPWR